jgi:HD-like signal output (HDOD) protein
LALIVSTPTNSPDFSTPERLVAAMGQLPPVARVLARLQQLLSDTNSSLSDVSGLIKLDPAMTTRVIQISNSVWFSRGDNCRTIDEAVNRIGFKEIYHLVSITAASALVNQPLPAYGRDEHTTWRESMSCAFAAELVAQLLGEDTAIAYMSGLLHSIGRIAINRALMRTGYRGGPLADEGFPGDFSVAELAMFGFTQAAPAALMLEQWNFSPEIVEPIRRQYDPLDAPEPHDRMSAVLYTARFLRTSFCVGEPAADLPGVDDVFQYIRLTREDVLGCQPALEKLVDRASQMLKS